MEWCYLRFPDYAGHRSCGPTHELKCRRHRSIPVASNISDIEGQTLHVVAAKRGAIRASRPTPPAISITPNVWAQECHHVSSVLRPPFIHCVVIKM